jgi:nucleotide-binding universal stress UspA family protein
MTIHRILVPIDGSELSLKAAESAAELAQRLVAAVTLLTVVEPPEAAAAYVTQTALEEVRRGLWRASEEMLHQAAARMGSLQPPVATRVVWGSPAAAIAAEADAGYQLVVMGSRGLGAEPIDRQLLGSVAERVLRRTHCPVLIIPVHAKK